MKKSVLTILLSVNLVFPLAYADNENIEEMCKLEATSNEVAEADMAQYVQDCVEDTKRIRAEMGGAEKTGGQTETN